MEYITYSITCKDENIHGIYVGSTSDFANRQKVHKCDSNDNTKNHIKLYKVINETGGLDFWEFKFLEVLTCTKSDARILERIWYDLLEADLNTRKPHISKKEKLLYKLEYDKLYSVNNKDKLSKYQKQYNLSNKEKIASGFSEKIYCPHCGLYHCRGNKAKHYKSQKHIDNLAKFTDE
jgi:hypothetical protein